MEKVKVVPLEKRACVKHAGVKTLRIHCDVEYCCCFVKIPINAGKEGGVESHEWRGCMYVLEQLVKFAECSGASLDSLLSLNR